MNYLQINKPSVLPSKTHYIDASQLVIDALEWLGKSGSKGEICNTECNYATVGKKKHKLNEEEEHVPHSWNLKPRGLIQEFDSLVKFSGCIQ